MVLATLGALAGSYAMEKASQASQNVSAKKSAKNQAIFQDWLNQQQFARQTAWEKEKLLNSYQWTMQDMKNAGLNPILGMAQNGATSASAPSGAGGSSALANTRGFNSKNIQDFMNTAKQLDQQDTQIEINKQQALSSINKQEAETINIIKEGKWIDPKNKKALEEAESRILNNASQSAKNNAITQKTTEEINQIRNGLIDKLMGTNPTMVKGLMNSVGMLGVGSVMGGAMKGIQAIKKARTAKQFGQFLNSIGK